MQFRKIIVLAFVLLQSGIVLAQHPDWEEKDSIIVSLINHLDLGHPAEVEKVFLQGLPKFVRDLGFGWGYEARALTGAAIQIFAQFYYYHDSIVSYTIQPEVANLPQKLKRYMSWYKAPFNHFDTVRCKINGGEQFVIHVMPYKYGEEAILRPINEAPAELQGAVISRKLLGYMSPASGLMYGYSGGLRTYNPNRALFDQFKDTLTQPELRALFYAINPVSRLMAIEYCMKTTSPLLFDEGMQNWINVIYEEKPEISSLIGCLAGARDARTLVEMFAKER